MAKTLWTIPEFCEHVGIGTSKAYEFARTSGCAVRIGRRVYIHIEAFDKWCERQLEI